MHRLLCSSSPEAHTDPTLSSATKMQQPACNVAVQGSSLETQCPRTLLGAGHIGTLRLARTKIPDSQQSRFITQGSPEKESR